MLMADVIGQCVTLTHQISKVDRVTGPACSQLQQAQYNNNNMRQLTYNNNQTVKTLFKRY